MSETVFISTRVKVADHYKFRQLTDWLDWHSDSRCIWESNSMSPKVWESSKWKLVVDAFSATLHVYDDELAVEVALNIPDEFKFVQRGKYY